jgi:hypothetical protein
MSTPAPTPQDPAIATAIAHAERRLWLLGMMIDFGMALIRAPRFGQVAGVLLAQVAVKAFAAISRGVRLCIRIEAETLVLLRHLTAGVLPVAKARRAAAAKPSAERAKLTETLERAPGERRETTETESDKAFRARLEALEALLDHEAQAGAADPTAHETLLRLCRVLGVKPEWTDWLGDEGPAPLRLPPPFGCSAPLLRSRGPPPQRGRGIAYGRTDRDRRSGGRRPRPRLA